MAGAAEAVLQNSEHSNISSPQGTSDRAGSAQLTYFHRFPDLPKEIRQKVFEACLPRRVFRYTYKRTWSHPIKSTCDLSRKPSALPYIAFVCKDAYQISKLFVREYHVDFTATVFSVDWNQVFIYGTTKIRFDADLDTLVVNYSALTSGEVSYGNQAEHDEHLQGLQDGPNTLIMSPKVNVVLDMRLLVAPRHLLTSPETNISWLTSRPYSDCLARHNHCTVTLALTVLSMTSQEKRSSGLFGMFGEEREIFVDIKDTAKIDQYERYIEGLRGAESHGETYFTEEEHRTCSLKKMGAGRYGTWKRPISQRRHTSVCGEDTEAPPAASTVAEQDAASALFLIKQAWLEAHDCFKPANDPLIPWTGDAHCRKWDDEHHVAKHWLSKLPKFSFVATYMAMDV